MDINTTLGLIDESKLIRTDRTLDNDNEHTTSVEYCLIDCTGSAHATGQPDSDGYFCSKHIHRSAHVTLKKMPAMVGETQNF